MPVQAKVTDAHKALISQLLADDADMREAARLYVLRGFKLLNELMVRGDPATQAAIAKSLTSVVTKAITETNDDDSDQSLREEMHRMMDEMRGEITNTTARDKPKMVPKK